MPIRVLFVEDEKFGVQPYFKELERNGFECHHAPSGEEAVRILGRKKIDLLSIDIMFLPGESLGENVDPVRAGLRLYELVRSGKIKNCDANIPIIILSAVTDPDIEEIIQTLDIVAFLKKPIDFDQVVDQFINTKERMMNNVKA